MHVMSSKEIWMDEAVQDFTWVLCLLTWIARQHCDQSGAVQRDVPVFLDGC